MLDETKQDIKEITEILIQLRERDRALLMSNATILLARQSQEERMVSKNGTTPHHTV